MMKKSIFSPFKIGNIEFKNRIFMSPMCQYSAKDGLVNDWHKTHYISRAIGGVGAIIIEATAVEPKGRISPNDLGLWNDKQQNAFKELITSIKEYGAKVGIQLAHAGRKGSTNPPWSKNKTLTAQEGGWQTIAPSPIPFSETFKTPKEMNQEDIENTILYFKQAAKRSIDAGFDFIEIHIAHGYLLHEFLSPISNKRTDNYGGSFENRCRLPLEIVSSIKSIMPAGMPLFVRISAVDWVDGGWDIEQSVNFCKMLKKNGVDLIDVSSGGLVDYEEIPANYGFQTEFSQIIKKESDIATGSVGMIVNPYQAEHIISSNQADIVLLGRALLHNPYWALHAAEFLNHKDKINWANQYLRASHLRY
jgi:2,4-dienoyl-CoA reductase-like NADH-dependent reductase (Old Yellow Enzyme family)